MLLVSWRFFKNWRILNFLIFKEFFETNINLSGLSQGPGLFEVIDAISVIQFTVNIFNFFLITIDYTCIDVCVDE